MLNQVNRRRRKTGTFQDLEMNSATPIKVITKKKEA
jgi:hypothetical protein